jgi:hypothetical protein
MTQPPRPWSIEELAAGDARRLPTMRGENFVLAYSLDGDPLTIAVIAARETPDGSAYATLLDPVEVGGDLDTAAARLGVDVADLIRARRAAGIAPSHRRPGILSRLFGRRAS